MSPVAISKSQLFVSKCNYLCSEVLGAVAPVCSRSRTEDVISLGYKLPARPSRSCRFRWTRCPEDFISISAFISRWHSRRFPFPLVLSVGGIELWRSIKDGWMILGTESLAVKCVSGQGQWTHKRRSPAERSIPVPTLQNRNPGRSESVRWLHLPSPFSYLGSLTHTGILCSRLSSPSSWCHSCLRNFSCLL